MGKEIYIVHQYYVPSHFKAIYQCHNEFGYDIKGYIILDKRSILSKCYHDFLKNKNIIKLLKNFFYYFKNLMKLRFLKDKVLIVGIAPYDYLLNRYAKVFEKNNSIYFTSWQYWDGTNFPRGDINNKDKYENILSKSFKGSACVTEETNRAMKKFFDNTAIVNHSINIVEYKQKKNMKFHETKRYLFLGTFDSRKNVPLILQWIKDSTFEFEFYFAGSGELEGEIADLARVDKRVHLLGRITKNKIKNELCTFDYLVLPSKEEPFGIVIIEALAAGLPCIVSDALGPKEIINNEINGYVFNKESADEFYNIMDKSFIINDEKYKMMSSNAIRSSKNYDVKYIANKWFELIKEIS